MDDVAGLMMGRTWRKSCWRYTKSAGRDYRKEQDGCQTVCVSGTLLARKSKKKRQSRQNKEYDPANANCNAQPRKRFALLSALVPPDPPKCEDTGHHCDEHAEISCRYEYPIDEGHNQVIVGRRQAKRSERPCSAEQSKKPAHKN